MSIKITAKIVYSDDHCNYRCPFAKFDISQEPSVGYCGAFKQHLVYDRKNESSYFLRCQECSDLIEPHPEDSCNRCGGRNPSWHAPSELWNKVTGHPAGLVLCPKCFQDKADEMGINTHLVVDYIENTHPSQAIADAVDELSEKFSADHWEGYRLELEQAIQKVMETKRNS